jgi:hypothetical protein
MSDWESGWPEGPPQTHPLPRYPGSLHQAPYPKYPRSTSSLYGVHTDPIPHRQGSWGPASTSHVMASNHFFACVEDEDDGGWVSGKVPPLAQSDNTVRTHTARDGVCSSSVMWNPSDEVQSKRGRTTYRPQPYVEEVSLFSTHGQLPPTASATRGRYSIRSRSSASTQRISYRGMLKGREELSRAMREEP